MLKLQLNPKRRKIFMIAFAIIFGLALGAAGFVAQKNFRPENIEEKSARGKPSPSPQTTTNPLDGLQVTKALANRRPLAVIIENHSEARPQTGLDKASIIYETMTEGGITRFMAIYGPREVQKVGPVRSMRTYFLDWSWEYEAFLAHVGGNIDALDRIVQENALSLDEFSLGDKAYWREPARGKVIEHTMYADIEKLYNAALKKNWEMKANFQVLKFLKLKDFKINNALTQEIILDFSLPQYKVKYTYDPINNNYPRTLAGFPHKDRQTGNQLSPTNLIIQAVERWEAPTRINENGWAMKTTGEGKSYVLYGGQKIDATWKKTDLKSRTLFYDSTGKEISFLPGQFWYEIVPPDVFEKIKIEIGTTVTQ